MLAFDHRQGFNKILNPKNPGAVSREQAIAAKEMVINALANESSGVLLDPAVGLAAYKGRTKPILLCLEKTGYSDIGKGRITVLEYKAEYLKKLGASGAKLLLYFNPEAINAAQQLDVPQQALVKSHENDLPFFLEIVTYGHAEAGVTKAVWVEKSVQMFLDAGITPEVFKLEYPEGNDAICARLTKILGRIPWILLTGGGSYDDFKTNLAKAIAAGCRGFLAGRAIWQEIGGCETIDEKRDFLYNTAKARFIEVKKIALG